MGMVEDALAYLSEVAENLGLEDDERESFINSGMARKGFKQVSSWAEPDVDDGDKGGGDFFSTKRRESQSRQVGGQRKSGGGGAGWAYGN